MYWYHCFKCCSQQFQKTGAKFSNNYKLFLWYPPYDSHANRKSIQREMKNVTFQICCLNSWKSSKRSQCSEICTRKENVSMAYGNICRIRILWYLYQWTLWNRIFLQKRFLENWYICKITYSYISVLRINIELLKMIGKQKLIQKEMCFFQMK